MSFINTHNSDYGVGDIPVYEGYDVENGGEFLLLEESYSDQLEIVKAIHASDLSEIAHIRAVREAREGGADSAVIESMEIKHATEVLTEATSAKGVWERIKDFFKKLWGKLKAFYASVVRYFDGIFRSAQGFVKKYAAQLKALDLSGSGYEAKIFEYQNLEGYKGGHSEVLTKKLRARVIGASRNQNQEELKKVVSELKFKKEDELASYRGVVAGESGSMSPEQFKTKIYGHFRKGARTSDDKRVVKVENITPYVDAITDVTGKAAVEETSRKNDSDMQETIKWIEDMRREFEGAERSEDGNSYTTKRTHSSSGGTVDVVHAKDNHSQVIAALHAFSAMVTSMKDIEMSGFGAWKSAWAERDSAYKHVCVGALSHKKKN